MEFPTDQPHCIVFYPNRADDNASVSSSCLAAISGHSCHHNLHNRSSTDILDGEMKQALVDDDIFDKSELISLVSSDELKDRLRVV